MYNFDITKVENPVWERAGYTAEDMEVLVNTAMDVADESIINSISESFKGGVNVTIAISWVEMAQALAECSEKKLSKPVDIEKSFIIGTIVHYEAGNEARHKMVYVKNKLDKGGLGDFLKDLLGDEDD